LIENLQLRSESRQNCRLVFRLRTCLDSFRSSIRWSNFHWSSMWKGSKASILGMFSC